MRKTIWKYELPEPGKQSKYPVPAYSEFMGIINGHAYLLVDPKFAAQKTFALHLRVMGTGHFEDMDPSEKYAGSWTEESVMGPLVWHAFYRISPYAALNPEPRK